jgi:enoyl-CoA hydratase
VTRLLDLMPELATELLQLLVKARYAAPDPLHRHPAQDPQRQDPALPAVQPPAHRTRRPGATLTGMKPLLVEQRGTVRWLLLNRLERRNALDITLIEALDKQITSAEADPGTAVIAVAGRGPSFCADGDFHQFLELHERGDNPVDFLADVSARFSRIAASLKPWVAVVHGHAVAGGLELALACDVVVAVDTTLIGDGHLNRRLVPAGGSCVRLPGAVGRGLRRR